MELGETIVTKEAHAIQSEVKIFTSSDYSIFKLSDLNREPTHYKKVLKSIKENDYTKYQPILVNNKMEIVDGQNRFLACKELGIPVHFIVSDEIKIFAAADINKASKNWSTEDFIKHYAKRGREPYIRFLEVCEKYGQKTTTVQHFGVMSKGATSRADNVRSGNFTFKKEVDIDDFFTHIEDFAGYYPEFYKKERFAVSMIRLYSHPDYNKDVMLSKLKIASGIVNEQPKLALMINEMLKLYNYGSGSRSRLEL